MRKLFSPKHKRWLKRKGCKNVALVDIERIDEEGNKYIETLIQPYYVGKEFVYISPMVNCEWLFGKEKAKDLYSWK